MSKFIQTVDQDEYLVIINLEAVSHVYRYADGALQIHLEEAHVVALGGEQANIVWEFLKAASWQIYEPQEDKK